MLVYITVLLFDFRCRLENLEHLRCVLCGRGTGSHIRFLREFLQFPHSPLPVFRVYAYAGPAPRSMRTRLAHQALKELPVLFRLSGCMVRAALCSLFLISSSPFSPGTEMPGIFSCTGPLPPSLPSLSRSGHRASRLSSAGTQSKHRSAFPAERVSV